MEHAEAMLDKLLEAAKTVGGAAWPMLVKRTYVQGWSCLIAGSLLLLAVWIARTYCIRLIKSRSSSDEGDILAAKIASLAAAILLSAFITALIGSGAEMVFAPEGATLARLLGIRG